MEVQILPLQHFDFQIKILYPCKKKSMSRIETLKSQFPQLDISLLDILSSLDNTKSHKYLQMLCKIFAKSYTFDKKYFSDYEQYKREIHSTLNCYEVRVDENESVNFIVHRFLENFFNKSDVQIFNRFREYNERGLIDKNDITKYSEFSDIRGAVSLCEMKVLEKELESQVHKEYEDDTWVILRPLSFQASAKYGSSTKWCTTYGHDKQYFFKYFHNGTLVYFINKKTGYKAAMHGLVYENHEKIQEISFWNAEDTRCDFFDIELDDYLFSIIKRIVSDNKTNSDFLTQIKLLEVAKECDSVFRLMDEKIRNVEVEPTLLEEIRERINTVPAPPLGNLNAIIDRQEVTVSPNMRA